MALPRHFAASPLSLRSALRYKQHAVCPHWLAGATRVPVQCRRLLVTLPPSMTPFSPSVGTPPLTPVDLTWYIRPLLTRRYLSTMVQVALGVLNPSTCQLCLASPPRCLSTLLRVPHSPLIPPPPPSLGMRRRPGLMRPSRTTVRALPLALCLTWRLARPLGIVASPSTRLAIGTRLKCRLLGGVRVFAPPPRLWRPQCTPCTVCARNAAAALRACSC